MKVVAVIKAQADDVAAAPVLTSFGERMETVDIVPGIL